MRKTKKKQDFKATPPTKKRQKRSSFLMKIYLGRTRLVGNYLWIVRFEGKKRLQNLKNDELKKKASESQKQKSHIFVYFRGLGKKGVISFSQIKSHSILKPFCWHSEAYLFGVKQHHRFGENPKRRRLLVESHVGDG